MNGKACICENKVWGGRVLNGCCCTTYNIITSKRNTCHVDFVCVIFYPALEGAHPNFVYIDRSSKIGSFSREWRESSKRLSGGIKGRSCTQNEYICLLQCTTHWQHHISTFHPGTDFEGQRKDTNSNHDDINPVKFVLSSSNICMKHIGEI